MKSNWSSSICILLGICSQCRFIYSYEITNIHRKQSVANLQVVNIPVNGQSWEDQLETGLIALEANCEQNYTPFNREKVRDELKGCLRTVIAQESRQFHLNPAKLTQIDIFRHFYVEPICNKVSQSLQCLKPHKKIIESCAREDGQTLQQLMKVTCKGNGSRIIEFIEQGGIDCITNEREEVAICFNQLTTATRGNLNSSTEVCRFFRQARDCLTSALNKCDKKKPLDLFNILLEEVVHETPGNCLSFPLTSSINGSGSSYLKTSLQLFSCLPLIHIALKHWE